MRRAHRRERVRRQHLAGHQGPREAQHGIDPAEQASMAGRAAEREGVLVMDLTAHDPAAPGARLGGGAEQIGRAHV